MSLYILKNIQIQIHHTYNSYIFLIFFYYYGYNIPNAIYLFIFHSTPDGGLPPLLPPNILILFYFVYSLEAYDVN